MMVTRQLAAAALGVAAALVPAAAQRPASLKDVPLYSGAGPPPAGEELPSPMLGVAPDTSRLYLVKAPIEAVVRFYQQRLAARELAVDEWATAVGRADAEPVAAVFAWLGVSMVDGYDVRRPKEQGTVLAIGAGVSEERAEEAEEAVEPEGDRLADDTARAQAPSPLKEPGPAELGVRRYAKHRGRVW